MWNTLEKESWKTEQRHRLRNVWLGNENYLDSEMHVQGMTDTAIVMIFLKFTLRVNRTKLLCDILLLKSHMPTVSDLHLQEYLLECYFFFYQVLINLLASKFLYFIWNPQVFAFMHTLRVVVRSQVNIFIKRHYHPLTFHGIVKIIVKILAIQRNTFEFTLKNIIHIHNQAVFMSEERTLT